MRRVLQDTRGSVLTLTLDRPDKLNAIDNDMAEQLLQALDAARDDAGVHVVRILGNGRAFCAGRDVSAPPTDRDLELVQAVAAAIVRHPCPVVMAVHGWTVGAGFEWAMCADFVIAAEDTRFRLPEASLGVFVTGGLVATLPASAGLARAKALTMLGEPFTAQDALDWGVIFRVVPGDALDAASSDVASTLASLKPEVMRQFKRVLNRVGLAAFDAAIEEENRAQGSLQ